eukprot:CAMPEP_0201946404 /NCGR_PEP_ID=MMETSP0903-20130614/54402_1 /ASSEMBLY_ACC=CAM_ASM_000552 /TAXON_ID=420261 /ORGANISM="Thalassiosira antarctica, Strain CCMP982" /LENGTH=411 /DNA_ID=CAMNT_0048489503 /DNA_START=38 /DNA_END=1274 /DNA_ORIENTATION=-
MSPLPFWKTGTPTSYSAGEFSFGIIADVQWADAPDGYNYARTVRRCYRASLTTLGDAVDWWLRLPEPPLFVAQLGDLIDGVNNEAQLGQTDLALKLALDHLGRLPCPSVNLVGNHELYNFDRRQLAEAWWLQHGDKEYYSFFPAEGWRVVVLDSYQISLIGHSEDDPRWLEAVEILARENPNVSPDGKDGDWLKGMEDAGYQRRFCPFNGGFGREQLDWFRSELKAAAEVGERVLVMSHVIIHPQACGGGTMVWDTEVGERVLVMSHVIIHPEACGGSTMTWDYEEALNVIRSDEAAGCVAAVLCGHDHSGNYHRDEFGVHHCTFKSPLSGGKAFGLMKVEAGYLEIQAPTINDLLPDVEGRPSPTTINNGSVLGPCESLKLQLSDVDASLVMEEKKISTSTIADQEIVAA